MYKTILTPVSDDACAGCAVADERADHISTIQASFLTKRLNVDGDRIQLNIWVSNRSVYGAMMM